MFCTLKHGNASEVSYSAERTAPPFLKSRSASKVACLSCRISKLKCDGDSNGCWRCLSRGIRCAYPPPTRSSNSESRSRQEENAGQRPQDVTVLDSDDDADAWGELGDSGLDLDFTAPDYDTMLMTAAPQMEAFLTTNSSSVAPTSCVPSLHTPTMATTNTSHDPDLGYLADLDAAGLTALQHQLPTATAPGSVSNEQPCPCLQWAVNTFEAIEINLVWHRKDNNNGILQDLKESLLSCDSLLGCSTCTGKHGFIMLLLAMCRHMTKTLEDIAFRYYGNQGASEDTPGHSRGWRETVKQSHQSSSAGGVTGGSGSIGSAFENYLGYRSCLRQLDDDDERIVSQSLVKARASRLEEFLVTRLDKVVQGQAWPSHKQAVDSLVDRVRLVLAHQ